MVVRTSMADLLYVPLSLWVNMHLYAKERTYCSTLKILYSGTGYLTIRLSERLRWGFILNIYSLQCQTACLGRPRLIS